MKKLLVLACTLGIAQPVLAGNINIGALTGASAQSDFRDLSEDLGSALSYKAVAPAASLGITGIDIGVEVTQTSLTKSAALWQKIGSSNISNLYVPKLHVTKGLPLNIDVALVAATVPTTGINLYGGELRYGILPGSMVMPALAIRGSMTKLTGVDQLAFDTKGLDISLSKGFAFFTPYIGVGQVWTNSNPDVVGLSAEKFTQRKMFVGANLNLGLTNLAAEYDKTGEAASTSIKLGFRF